MLTPKQKEKYQEYILDNLDKYVIDSRGNFVHINSELMGDEENDELYFIGKGAVSNWEEMVDKIAAIILQNKEDWEVVLDGGYYLKNKKDGRLMNEAGFGLERSYEIIGEIGYRQGAWKNYEEEIKLKREWKKFEDNLKKEREENEKKEFEEQAKQRRLNQHKDKVATEIKIALRSGTLLTNNELSPQYQKWETQINQLTDLESITNLQNRILADIQARRQEKISTQKAQENLDKIKTGTKKEQAQAWQNLEKQETEKGYQNNREQIERLKKEQAVANTREYKERTKKSIEKKLTTAGVKAEELSAKNQQEWQKLQEGKIQDSTQLVTVETKIKQNIYQKEAEKRITNLTAQVNQVLASLSSPSQITTLKKELLSFLSSNNTYYSPYQTKAEQLLSQLENYTSHNNHNSSLTKPDNFPWRVVVPFLLGGLLLLMLVVRRRKKFKHKGEKK